MTTVIASTIHISTIQTLIFNVNGTYSIVSFINRIAFWIKIDQLILVIKILIYRVPHQIDIWIYLVVFIHPTSRFYSQTIEFQNQSILDSITFEIGCLLCGRTKDTSLITSIQLNIILILDRYIGIITSTHHFVIDNDRSIENHLVHTLIGHTADVATTEEGTNLGGISLVISTISVFFVIHQRRNLVQSHSLHIGGESGRLGEIQSTEIIIFILLQYLLIHHLLTIVAEEHLIGHNVRTHLQFNHGLGNIGLQCGTVSTTIDTTTDHSRMIFGSQQTDRYLLCIGTVGIKGFDWCSTPYSISVIKVSIVRVIFPSSLVCISIGTITTTIYITTNRRIDTNGIAAIHSARHIVTTIHIVNVTTTYQHTSRKTTGEVILQLTMFIKIG